MEVEGLHPAAHEARGRIAQREARIDEAQIDAELLLRYRGCDGELGLGWMQGGELGLGGTPARSPAQVRACMVQSLPKRSQSLAMAWCAFPRPSHGMVCAWRAHGVRKGHLPLVKAHGALRTAGLPSARLPSGGCGRGAVRVPLEHDGEAPLVPAQHALDFLSVAARLARGRGGGRGGGGGRVDG